MPKLLRACFFAVIAATPVSAQEPTPAQNWDCAATLPDTDDDGLSDECELQLATYFAPVLVVHPGGCNWDDSIEPARPGGGYFFAVRRVRPNAVRIAYLPAYYRDCGWRGLKCLLPYVDCAPHAGDSEFIVIEAVLQDRSWRTEAIFLSSHCFGRHDKDCRWYAGDQLASFEWHGSPNSAPVIWVAEGRHANYPSKRACDRGIHAIDTCDRNSFRLRYPIVSAAQNIGSAHKPAHESGCVRGGAIWNSRREDRDVVECFWDARKPFAGWQKAPGVTPYYKYLIDIADFESK